MMKVEIDLPEIEGFEYTGEYRTPKAGENFVSHLGPFVATTTASISVARLILKKKAPAYKTTTVDTGRELFKYVEIQALIDALEVIEDLAISENDRVIMRALQELISASS